MPEQIERTDDSDELNVECVDYGSVKRAHHVRREEFKENGEYAEVGFDTTRFESPRYFLLALLEGGLVDGDVAGMELDGGVFYNPHRDSHYAEVHRSPEYYNFTWSNEELLIVVSINPFTGRHGKADYDAMLEASDEGLPTRKDICGYIGIEGKKDRVDRLVASIKANSNAIKAFDPDRRSFV